MTVGVAVIAAVLLACGVGALVPDGPAWRRAWQAVGRRVADHRDRDGGQQRAAWGLGLLGVVVAASGRPVLGLLVGGTPAAALAVRRRRWERRRRALSRDAALVARAVADGLDAGFGVRGAIADAARTAPIESPAGDELRSVAARLAAGDPLPTALDGWRRRTDEPGHATLVAGLLLHGESGGALVDVLRDQATALDRARRQAAEAESAIVQARAAARIVGGIPAVTALAAVAFAPDAVRQMIATPAGVVLVALAMGLQVVAALAVRRLAAEPR